MKTVLDTPSSRFYVVALFMCIFTGALFASPSVHAMDWDAGKIIDDIIFTNSNTMSSTDIQNFLNSKISECDSDGSEPSEYGGGTRAQWAQATYGQSTFTCLKDYSEGGLSAAQIIYNAGQQYQINPQVLIVLLQKEQGLVTDEWPLNIQYRSATGYGCPDTAPCDTQYYGLTNQLSWAAKMFRAIMNNSPTWYTPYVLGNNYIQYNPQASCGGSTVNIQNRATQALYNYTPYQPNQASIAAGWGTAPCGAYGNRNFKLYFNNWFGATTNSSLEYSVIQVTGSPALYLQTPAGKYYIPSGSIMENWGIDEMAIRQVTQAYADSLPTGPWVGKLLKDDWDNYFIVEDGKLHYVRNSSYLPLWGLRPQDAVRSLGLSYLLIPDSWAGRFITDKSQTNGQIWLLDAGKKRLVSDQTMLYQWRYTPDQLTTVSGQFLSTIPSETEAVSEYATDGSMSYLIDTGRKLSLDTVAVKDALMGSRQAITYSPAALSFLSTAKGGVFVANSTTGQWFMYEGGRRHYIPKAVIAENWGMKSSSELVFLSGSFVDRTTNAEDLSYLVQTGNPSAYWLIDGGSKRYIPTAQVANSWLRAGASLPTYSSASLGRLPQGSNATSKVSGSTYNYILDGGYKRYVPNSSDYSAWVDDSLQASSQLLQIVPELGAVNNVVSSPDGSSSYLISNRNKYPIADSAKESWGISASTPRVATSTLDRLPTSSTLNSFVKVGDISYVLSEGKRYAIKQYVDAFQPQTLGQQSINTGSIPTGGEASFLIQNSNNEQMWLISEGKKTPLSFAQQVSLGYLSRGIKPVKLPLGAIGQIPDSSAPFSLLIQKVNSGIKLLNFGASLGFPDGQTLLSFVPAEGVFKVSDSIYDHFQVTGSVSRVVVDDLGRYFLVQGGTKQWISNGTAYKPYEAIPRVYIYGTTAALIADGPSL